MKIEVVIVFTFLLSFVFVSADLQVPCSENRECSVSLGGAYSRVQRMCISSTVSQPSQSPPMGLIPQTKILSWNLLAVQEYSSSPCRGDSCLSFAPETPKNSFQTFVDFLLYVNV